MRFPRWLVVISGVLLIAVATALYALPTIARHVAIARLHAITKRPVSIDRVDVGLLRATLKKASIVGSRLTEAKQVESAEDGRPQVKLDFAEPESRRRE